MLSNWWNKNYLQNPVLPTVSCECCCLSRPFLYYCATTQYVSIFHLFIFCCFLLGYRNTIKPKLLSLGKNQHVYAILYCLLKYLPHSKIRNLAPNVFYITFYINQKIKFIYFYFRYGTTRPLSAQTPTVAATARFTV